MAMNIKNQTSAIIRCTFIDIRYMEQYTLKSPYGQYHGKIIVAGPGIKS